jgi:hypothetical protein
MRITKLWGGSLVSLVSGASEARLILLEELYQET